MNELEQSLLLWTSLIIISGALVVAVWQWWRSRGDRGEDFAHAVDALPRVVRRLRTQMNNSE